MRNVRRLILFLSSIVGLWVIASGIGVIVDPANSAFWSDSLMWSVLTCLIVLPAPLVANIGLLLEREENSDPRRKATEEQAQSTFVDEDDRIDTLWPEAAAKDWPPPPSDEEEHTHA